MSNFSAVCNLNINVAFTYDRVKSDYPDNNNVKKFLIHCSKAKQPILMQQMI